MATLRSELSRLQKERNVATITELREAMEDTRERTWEVIQFKQDCWQPIGRELNIMEAINKNIELVKQSLNSLIPPKWKHQQ